MFTSTQTISFLVLYIGQEVDFTPITTFGTIPPVAFSIDPVLPTGLSFDILTARITGSPTIESRDIGYIVTATDSTSASSDEWFILSTVPALTSTSLISSINLTATVPVSTFKPVSASGGYSQIRWTISPTLPAGLAINSVSGDIYGTPIEASTLRTYYIYATDDIGGHVTTQTLALTVKKFPWETPPSWENTGSLGTLVPGEISELKINGIFSTSTLYPIYRLTNGSLPDGLSLERDGTISGQVNVNPLVTNSISTSNFSVSVTDTNNNIALKGDFSITVNQTSSTDYTQIYCRPFLTQAKRSDFLNFIKNENVFDPEIIYRPFDENFGKAQDLRVVLDFGIEVLTLRNYAEIISQNFYKRQLSIGEVKTAFAKNDDGTIRYEFVYLDIIDKHVNSSKISIPSEITYNGTTYYPPSIPNMRARFASSATLTTVRNPSFTNFVQEGDTIKLGYIPFIPLCFTLPGKSATVVRKIKENGFKFNTLHFEMDRLIVQKCTDQTSAKYLLLNRDSRLA